MTTWQCVNTLNPDFNVPNSFCRAYVTSIVADKLVVVLLYKLLFTNKCHIDMI